MGYARRNYMVPVPKAENLTDLNDRFLRQCLAYGDHRMAGREQTVNELYEEEEKYLITLPEVTFSNILTPSGKADKYSTVIIDNNRYSVPTEYAYFQVKVILHIDRIDIFYGTKKIATHKRLYGKNKWSLKPEHYLELIQQRPQSFESARPIRQWRENWPNCLEQLLKRFCQKQGSTKGVKDFISVLMLYKDHKADDIEHAVDKALKANVSSSQAVEHILLNANGQSPSFSALDNWQTLPPPDVSVYSQIGGEI